MKYSVALATLAITASASDLGDNVIVARQQNDAEAYINEVCFPNTTSPVPPCQAIVNIESACQPNGTAAIDYAAHQQCMCNGGYFNNWVGCLNCQYVHGTRSEAVAQAFEAILSSASAQFCTATPTAVFADYFSAVSDSAPQAATGAATTTSDQFPSQSAVSLYYTATGPQGPGAITGSATAATASVSSAASSRSTSLAAGAASTASLTTSSGSRHTSASASGSGAGSSSASAATTSAAQTGAANVLAISQGLIALVAGVMMLM